MQHTNNRQYSTVSIGNKLHRSHRFMIHRSYYHYSKYSFSTVTVPESSLVFNSSIHKLNQKHASLLSNSYEYDYFRSEIATRLISRILDLDGEYPTALDFGCHSGQLYKELINFIRQNPSDKLPGGIKELYQVDTCKELLHRDEIPKWQTQLINPHRILMDTFDGPQTLPFEDDKFDLIVTGMSLQWINNIPFIFSELQRCLKPDGCFIGAFSGGTTLQELRSSLLLADQERKGGMNNHMSPAINISDIGSLLGRAKFVMITVDNEIIEIPYPNMFVLCEHLRGMGDQHSPIIPNNISRYHGISRDIFISAAAIYDAMYSDSITIEQQTRDELNEYLNKQSDDEALDNISIDATMQIIYFMAWAPSPTQRKPMERGTAKFSMKDLEDITEFIEEKEKEFEEENKDKDDKDDDDKK